MDSKQLREEVLKLLKKDWISPYSIMLKLNEKYDWNFYSKVTFAIDKLATQYKVSKRKAKGAKGSKNEYKVMS